MTEATSDFLNKPLRSESEVRGNAVRAPHDVFQNAIAELIAPKAPACARELLVNVWNERRWGPSTGDSTTDLSECFESIIEGQRRSRGYRGTIRLDLNTMTATVEHLEDAAREWQAEA